MVLQYKDITKAIENRLYLLQKQSNFMKFRGKYETFVPLQQIEKFLITSSMVSYRSNVREKCI